MLREALSRRNDLDRRRPRTGRPTNAIVYGATPFVMMELLCRIRSRPNMELEEVAVLLAVPVVEGDDRRNRIPCSLPSTLPSGRRPTALFSLDISKQRLRRC